MKKIAIVILILSVLTVASCRRFEQQIRVETLPEGELYSLAMEKFNQEEWESAIAAFDRFERLYVNSEKIREVRLKRADAQFNRGTLTGYLSAKAEYQQFIALYPNFPREDYIWFQIANCSVQQMLPPNRDQSPTETAIQDLELFVTRYQDSEYIPQARELLNQAYQRLAQYNVIVGDHYFGRGIYMAAQNRYQDALELNVPLENLEEVMYKLVFSLAKSARAFHMSYEGASQAELDRPDIIEFYSEKYRTSLFNARKYLEEYKASFPNSSRIAELEAEVNMIPVEDVNSES